MIQLCDMMLVDLQVYLFCKKWYQKLKEKDASYQFSNKKDSSSLPFYQEIERLAIFWKLVIPDI